MEKMKIVDCIPNGIVTLPPSKSLFHRALICAALAGEGSIIEAGGIISEDVEATLNCLGIMGLQYRHESNRLKIIKGVDIPANSVCTFTQSKILNCGESGSTLRFIIPLTLLTGEKVMITGGDRLMERPIADYISALEANGGEIGFDGKSLQLQGNITPGTFVLPGDVSSQYVSGLLMALPLLNGDSEIILTSELESKPYVDLTLHVMNRFGVNVEAVGNTGYKIRGGQRYVPGKYMIEGDWSAAAFFLVAGALGCKVGCKGLNIDSLQGDKTILQIIEKCGGSITVDEEGCIYATANEISPIEMDVRDFPDLVPPLAVLLCFCEGVSRIYGAKRLRLKESDRLHALTVLLNGMGADITEGDDCLIIKGVKRLKGGTVEPSNDHRIAMALAIASIKSERPVTTLNADCVNKSYPDFWNDFCILKKEFYKEKKNEQYLGKQY